jgi:hypothetical protein
MFKNITQQTTRTLAIGALLAGAVAFAEGPAATPAPAKEVKTKVAKVSIKELKAECLKENAGLKGKELHKCVQEKKHAVK